MTNLYNARPQWLADAHAALDAAVAAAYGWPADISDEDACAGPQGRRWVNKPPHGVSTVPRGPSRAKRSA